MKSTNITMDWISICNQLRYQAVFNEKGFDLFENDHRGRESWKKPIFIKFLISQLPQIYKNETIYYTLIENKKIK